MTAPAIVTRRAPYRGRRCALPRCDGAASWTVAVQGVVHPTCAAHAAMARRERARFLAALGRVVAPLGAFSAGGVTTDT